jgi:metal-responsive CopG/Arc/MetJ family transcriptional regulator
VNKLTAITFSVEQEVKDAIDDMAQAEHRSKSDIFRDMYQSYLSKKFEDALRELQADGAKVAERLGLQSDEDVIQYLRDH